MLNIICVCHNGMGTSMLLKINVNNICMDNGISATVDACSSGEAMGYLMNADIVLTTPEIVDLLPPTDAVIVQTQNIMDKDTVEKLLVDCVKENFPNEIS